MASEDERGGRIAASYDLVAEEYANTFFDELARKPFDRQLLDRFAQSVQALGLVCDVGCGPGHIARYLYERGVQVCGLDLSAEMVRVAQRLNPQIPFEQGNMLSLSAPDGTWGGIACFYSLIHLSRSVVPQALAGFWRALRPGGRLLLAVHGGAGEVHSGEWFGKPVSIDATLFESQELAGYLGAAGFAVEESLARSPYDFEYQTQRLYLFASKPARAPEPG
ncbi:MAG TPA: class I SAM-dependent methyltransferase [Ktedonobacterales bacterium]|jgi:SAM-dependent methyltransferase